MALIQKLKNLAPDYRAEFLTEQPGLVFRMTDSAGRIRSRTVSIYPYNNDNLTRTKLDWELRRAGFPGVFKG